MSTGASGEISMLCKMLKKCHSRIRPWIIRVEISQIFFLFTDFLFWVSEFIPHSLYTKVFLLLVNLKLGKWKVFDHKSFIISIFSEYFDPAPFWRGLRHSAPELYWNQTWLPLLSWCSHQTRISLPLMLCPWRVAPPEEREEEYYTERYQTWTALFNRKFHEWDSSCVYSGFFFLLVFSFFPHRLFLNV